MPIAGVVAMTGAVRYGGRTVLAVIAVSYRSLVTRPGETPAAILAAVAATVPADAAWDGYGEGGLVAELERETAALLGKDAAVFGVSGKTVQLAALRVHADARARRTIAVHPRAHIVEDEDDAIGALWGLRVARTGTMIAPFDRAQLAEIAEPLAAVVVELPLRRAGRRVPEWATLTGLADDARARGAAFHLDGARLWECAPGYGRELAQIAALADTVYVSFYKGLGGLAGGALAGDAATVAAVRAWVARAGCTPYRMTPYAAAALHGLRTELPRMAEYVARARALARRFAALDGIAIEPEPPSCNGFTVHVARSYDELLAARDRVRDGAPHIELFRRAMRVANLHASAFEFTVTPAADAIADDEIVAAVAQLAG